MSHRQHNYKARGRGGAFERLGLPVRQGGDGRDGGFRGRGGPANRFPRGQGGQGRGNQRFPRRGGASLPRRYVRGGTNVAIANGGFIFTRQDRVEKDWYKVVIIRGADYGREALLKAISNYIEAPVFPVLYKVTEDGSATFLVDNQDIADSIEAASRRVSAPGSQQKLNIRVTKTGPPYVPLTTDEEELIKKALPHRYNPMEQSLNLAAFTFDDAFKDDRGRNLSLQRNNVMMSVIDLIGREQAIADKIQVIDVSENRLRFMDYFANLVPRLPNVVKLVMHHNQIDSIQELEKLVGWNLLELDLDQTPLSGRYRNRETYAKDIRRVFKKLTKLDGFDLPAQSETKFGLDNDEEAEAGGVSLPPTKPSFFLNDEVRDIVLQFLELYFVCFDSEDRKGRQKLLEAYSDEATFTVSAVNMSAESHAARGESWQEIQRDSHNILKVEFWERFRAKLVHQGKLAILSYFCNNFPMTSHMAESFVVDVSFASGNVLCLNVNGVFRERRPGVTDPESLPLRFFNRVFLLVKNERGLVIVNEMLFISTLTASQFAAYRKQMERAAVIQAPPIVGAAEPMAAVPMVDSIAGPSNIPEVDLRQQMVEQMTRETGMKPMYAQKCLEDYDYNYAQASAAFNQLRQENKIPPDAFQ